MSLKGAARAGVPAPSPPLRAGGEPRRVSPRLSRLGEALLRPGVPLPAPLSQQRHATAETRVGSVGVRAVTRRVREANTGSAPPLARTRASRVWRIPRRSLGLSGMIRWDQLGSRHPSVRSLRERQHVPHPNYISEFGQ